MVHPLVSSVVYLSDDGACSPLPRHSVHLPRYWACIWIECLAARPYYMPMKARSLCARQPNLGSCLSSHATCTSHLSCLPLRCDLSPLMPAYQRQPQRFGPRSLSSFGFGIETRCLVCTSISVGDPTLVIDQVIEGPMGTKAYLVRVALIWWSLLHLFGGRCCPYLVSVAHTWARLSWLK